MQGTNPSGLNSIVCKVCAINLGVHPDVKFRVFITPGRLDHHIKKYCINTDLDTTSAGMKLEGQWLTMRTHIDSLNNQLVCGISDKGSPNQLQVI